MVKVLLCGAVAGGWALLFERVRKLNAAAKGAPFELLVCVGGVLPFPPEYLSGERQVPIPTYLLPGVEPATDALDARQQELRAQIEQAVEGGGASVQPVEIAANCFVLAGKGVVSVAGLSIAYLSGSKAAGGGQGSPGFHYTDDDVAAVASQIVEQGKESDIDFLFTADLPSSFQNLLPEQQVPAELQQHGGSDAVAKMLEVVLPKYHITSSDVFYQRLPYVSEHSVSGRKQLTRLISLSAVNKTKDMAKKYLHALQVVPTSAAAGEQLDIPAGTTQNPYVDAAQQQRQVYEPASKRQRLGNSTGLSAEQVAALTQQGSTSSQFFYDQRLAERGQRRGNLIPGQGDRRQGERRGNGSGHPHVPERSECWFCLATPTLERHLIVSIGEEAYLAMPKGAISVDHVLIVPIAHEMSTAKLSDATWKEMARFKEALRAFFASQGKELLVLDRNTTTIGATHCHLQVVGVPKDKAAQARSVFEVEGDKYRVKLEELEPEADVREKAGGKPFFYAEVPDGQGGAARLLQVVEDKHYVQFGRHAAAHVLGLPRRANWKFCVVPKDEEEALTQAFKRAWRPYDFTIEGDDEETA